MHMWSVHSSMCLDLSCLETTLSGFSLASGNRNSRYTFYCYAAATSYYYCWCCCICVGEHRCSIVTTNWICSFFFLFSTLLFHFLTFCFRTLLLCGNKCDRLATLNTRLRIISVLTATFLGWLTVGYKSRRLLIETWNTPPLCVGKWCCSCSDGLCITITQGKLTAPAASRWLSGDPI